MSGKSIAKLQPSLPGLMVADVPLQLLERARQLISEPFSATVIAPQDVIDAAKHWYPIVRDSMLGATSSEREDQLLALADHPGWTPAALRSGDPVREATFWAAYHADLQDVPAFALAEGCRHAREDQKLDRMPRSGELLAYARRSERWREGLRVAEGLRRLSLAFRERERGAPVDGDTWEEMQRRLAELRNRINSSA